MISHIYGLRIVRGVSSYSQWYHVMSQATLTEDEDEATALKLHLILYLCHQEICTDASIPHFGLIIF